MWEVGVPIYVSTAIVALIELCYGAFIFPSLASYAAHLDARRWRERIRLSKIRCYHVVTGGHPFGRYTTGVFLLSVAIAVGFAFSLDATDIPITKAGYADTVEMKNNYSVRAHRDLTEATRICSEITLTSTVIYRKPLMYKHLFRAEGGREGNTRFDRVVGSWFTSCTGSRLGETLPSNNVSRETVEVHTECCEKCETQREKMKLFVRVFAIAPDNTKINRSICSSQNTPLLRQAFAVLKANLTVAQPFLHLNNNIIPGYVWRFSERKEERRYVSRVDRGTKIGYSALLNILLLFVLIPFLIDLRRWRGRQVRTFHGMGESDIAAWWSVAWWARAQDGTGVDLDDAETHRFRIACAQLGLKEVEESLEGVGCNAFERERLSVSSVSIDDGAKQLIPTYKCPICGDKADKDDLLKGWRHYRVTADPWTSLHISRLSLLQNCAKEDSLHLNLADTSPCSSNEGINPTLESDNL